jgi:hypothetical protein
MNDAATTQTRVIDENELNRRIALAFEEATYAILDPNGVDKAREIIVYGKVKPDPWEEWVHELSDALGFLPGKRTALNLEAALLKLRPLVEKEN